MIVELSGQVMHVTEKENAKGRKFKLVQLLQDSEKRAEVLFVKLWNGTKAEPGKPLKVSAEVAAYKSKESGEARLSVDVW